MKTPPLGHAWIQTRISTTAAPAALFAIAAKHARVAHVLARKVGAHGMARRESAGGHSARYKLLLLRVGFDTQTQSVHRRL